MSTDSNKGNYLCRVCGQFFQSTNDIKVSCTHCKSNQFSISAWDQVIQKRNQKLNFREEDSNDSLKVKPAGEDIVSQQLDIYGRKKRRRSLYILTFSLIWVIGIVIFAFKTFNSNDAGITTLDEKKALDGSLTLGEFDDIQQLAKVLLQTYTNFFATQENAQKVKYLYQWDIDKLNHFLNSPNGFTAKSCQRISYVIVNGNLAEASLVTGDVIKQLVLFSKIDNQWKIDFDQFVNYNTMDFADFINQKVETPHTFKLYFRASKSGLSQLITLAYAQPNNENYDFKAALSTTLNIKNDEPIYNDLIHLIKIWKNYKQFNHTLDIVHSSHIGKLDPPNYNRVTITLQHEFIDGEIELKIKEINAAHWIGEHYKDFMTPAQKLTLPIM